MRCELVSIAGVSALLQQVLAHVPIGIATEIFSGAVIHIIPLGDAPPLKEARCLFLLGASLRATLLFLS